MKSVLFTGGAGYGVSHGCLSFFMSGYNVHVIDNLNNSYCKSLRNVDYLFRRLRKESDNKISFFISVMRYEKDLLEGFENINNCKILYEFSTRREGDIASYYTNVEKVKKIFYWKLKIHWKICVKIVGLLP